MNRALGDKLLNAALDELRRIGYDVLPREDTSFGRNARTLYRDGHRDCSVLVQGRTFNKQSYRYLIGIIIPDLRRVDKFVPWFARENVAYMIPADFMCGILENCIADGTARYSTNKRQWRVDFHLQENQLSPQGSDGYRYSIREYRIDIPPK